MLRCTKKTMKHLIEFQIILIVVVQFFITLWHFPSLLTYVTDVITIGLFFTWFLLNRKANVLRNYMRATYWLIGIYLLYCVAAAFFKGVPIHLFLWGARNVFRFLAFFFVCAEVLEVGDSIRFHQLLLKFYWLNFIVLCYEKFVLGYRNDYLGGLFGVDQGCNGMTILFITLILAYKIGQFLYQKTSFTSLIIYSISYFLIAALAELKVCFVLYVWVIAVDVLLMKFNWRKLAIVIVSVIIFIVGITILAQYNPESLQYMSDYDAFSEYLNESFRTEISFTRGNSVSLANEYFFKDDIILGLTGYGLGNCDMSSYFQSFFYQQYGFMNYRQYFISMTLLQLGYVGVFLYAAILISIFAYAARFKKLVDDYHLLLVQTTICICVVLAFYNFTLQIEIAYLVWFYLSMALIYGKEIYKGKGGFLEKGKGQAKKYRIKITMH